MTCRSDSAVCSSGTETSFVDLPATITTVYATQTMPHPQPEIAGEDELMTRIALTLLTSLERFPFDESDRTYVGQGEFSYH